MTTDTFGVFSHGTNNLYNYIRKMLAGGLYAKAVPTVEKEGPSWAIVNGNAAMGMVSSCRAMELAIEKAKKTGIAYVGVHNSCHFGAAGYYANLAAQQGLLGIAMSNTDPNMAIPGSRDVAIGNNPFSFAAPLKNGKSVFLAIALSGAAALKIVMAREKGQQVPPGFLIDAEGLPTTDPSGFPYDSHLLPMAAHKGYGFAIMVEILASVLTGAGLLSQVVSWNLDLEATEQLAQILDELKRAGSAILVVDHRLYWLRDTADEVFVMQAGEIRERGLFSILEDEALRARWGLRRDTVSDPRATLPRVKVEEGLCEEEKAGAVFTAEKLSFGYPGRSAIFADAAFAVPAGITALIGDNGTGKTTLARILTGLLKAEGRFALDGNAVGKEGLMPSAGLVLQNADHQLTMRTVEEEIIAAMLAGRWAKENRSGWSGDLGHFAPTDAEKARLESLLASLRLAPLRGRHPQSLSGGEKQRVVIACALAKDPRILILDEPTSGLDGANLASIAGILREEADKGRAVFLITHDLELLDACDRALDMTDFQQLTHKDNPS